MQKLPRLDTDLTICIHCLHVMRTDGVTSNYFLYEAMNKKKHLNKYYKI